MKTPLKTMVISAIFFTALPVFANNMNMDSKFQKMDTNNDGMVSADEHAAYGKMMFDKADTNKDGSLSKSEMMSMKKNKNM
jgi:hypothetical protein